MLRRSCGVVLHLTSLPGRYGIGDCGPEAYRFVDLLVAAGQTVWQVMPLGPTGYGDSPYQCFSAFAGNPLLISPDLLVEDGWLNADDLTGAPAFPEDHVAYCDVIAWKDTLLRKVHQRFREGGSAWRKTRFERFRHAPGVAGWLRDYALFRALKDHHEGKPWTEWEPALARREEEALAKASRELAEDIERHELYQFLFSEQWQALRQHANQAGVRILGDIPIFVAHDSADAWAHRGSFLFEEDGSPRVVAGVPPDYFSPTGQRWGNPLYDWEVMEADGFTWWIERLRTLAGLVDMVRLDHFRGFQAYWEVPAAEETAMNGRWIEAPGEALFRAIRDDLGDFPILAEDLGVITPEVEALRDRFGFPGMKVLQFGFGDDATNEYLPHNHVENCVVYTGTHDNDTTVGWYGAAGPAVQDRTRRYLGTSGEDISWDLLRWAYASVGRLALAPFQDMLRLGSEARMNTPGQAEKNWAWRFTWDQVDDTVSTAAFELARLYGRV